MNEMKKTAFALLAAAFLATPAMAAMPITAGAELGFGISFNDGLDGAGFGDRVGFPIINLRGMFLLENVQVGANPLAVGGMIGYDRLYSFEYDLPTYNIPGMGVVGGGTVETSVSSFPLLALVQARPIAQPLYVEAGLGFAIVSWSSEANGVENSDSELDFGLLLGAGYAIGLNEQMEIPVGARMMMIFNDGSSKQIQITAGFNYKL